MHSCYEVLKILKFRTPMPVYSSFTLSDRNNRMALYSSDPSHHFNSQVRPLWNTALKLVARHDVTDFSLKIGTFKNGLKTYLLKIQNQYDDIEWYPDNFEFKKIGFALS